eukprot:6467504-Amphidinium_carterae.1
MLWLESFARPVVLKCIQGAHCQTTSPNVTKTTRTLAAIVFFGFKVWRSHQIAFLVQYRRLKGRLSSVLQQESCPMNLESWLKTRLDAIATL